MFFFSWRGPSFWRACPTQISHALLFWDGLALLRYLGVGVGRGRMADGVCCDLGVLVVLGLIWVFWWWLVLFGCFGDGWCHLGVFGDGWCGLSVLVVFGVISVFWWFLVWYGQGWCFCGFCTKFMGFRKEFYVSVKTWFSSGWVFLVVAALGNSSFLNIFCMFSVVFPIPENWHKPANKHGTPIRLPTVV